MKMHPDTAATITRHLKTRMHASDPTLACVKTRLPMEALRAYLQTFGVQALSFDKGSRYHCAVVYREQLEARTPLRVETPGERARRYARGKSPSAPATPLSPALDPFLNTSTPDVLVASSPLALRPLELMQGVPHFYHPVN